MEILNLKSKITKLKNLLEKPNGIFKLAEESLIWRRIDRDFVIQRTERKKIKKNKQRLRKCEAYLRAPAYAYLEYKQKRSERMEKKKYTKK